MNNAGTVFRITYGGALTTLYSFTGEADGSGPMGTLLQGADGNFYGTTSGGGTNHVTSGGDGTIFRITTNGALTTLFSFNCANGCNPIGALVQGKHDGGFYGTTSAGGTLGYGTVFRMTKAGAFTTLYSFGGTDGAYPWVGVTEGTDGNFYGTTTWGGTGFNASGSLGYGTIYWFSMQPVFQTMTRTGGVVALTWGALPGLKYQVQYKTNLSQTNWSNLGSASVATNTTMTASDSIAFGRSQRWYRVALLP